ncbi:hypothetical protein [Atopomonas sediminilitoris]|uniref:hypothetical protein n=1 Tax=Atopomonas sediminilitoris TaxID=2919919 RepID=UPI001F4DE0E9|nr:hypothetical protein [Atopomonas sediminilitoris]MCJ8168655.1 hypothetical protein [Atopomonas sediminilitoris]
MPLITRPISAPCRAESDWQSTWQAEDEGLIKCWEVGRQLAESTPELAAAALRDELPVLGWKGGVSRALKKLDKPGSLQYLAQWQGLRGEDLNIDTSHEVTLTCSRTGMRITFTSDINKLLDQTTEEPTEGEDDGRPASGVREQPLFS